MKKNITIGDKPLMQISKEDVAEIATIEGCCPCMDYWSAPIIVDFNNTMFSDTVILDHFSERNADGLRSGTIVFYLNCRDLTYHYHEEGQTDRFYRDRLKIESIKFLIQQGYDIPVY